MGKSRIVVRLKEGALMNNVWQDKEAGIIRPLYSFEHDPHSEIHKYPHETGTEKEVQKFDSGFYKSLGKFEKQCYQTYLIDLESEKEAGESIEKLKSQYGEHIEQVYIDGFVTLCAPNDPFFTRQRPALDSIQCEDAWDSSKGQGVVVGILDTGINAHHPDLQGKILGIKNHTTDTNNIDYPDPRHLNGHGTAIAGIIAALGDNNQGIIGTAPLAQLYISKIFFDQNAVAFVSDCEAAIINADQRRIPILNCSWTIDTFDPIYHDSHQNLVNIINQFSNKMLFVFAAGNISARIDQQGAFLNELKGILKVGALDEQNQRKRHDSNFGSDVVYAPGENIFSTDRHGSYNSFTGTSFAAPFVAGISALLLSRVPTLKPADIKRLIEQNVDPVASLPKSDGIGKVNALKAMQALIGIA